MQRATEEFTDRMTEQRLDRKRAMDLVRVRSDEPNQRVKPMGECQSFDIFYKFVSSPIRL